MKSIVVKADELFEHATADTGPLGNMGDLKNEAWLMTFKILDILKVKVLKISQTCGRQKIIGGSWKLEDD